LAVENKPPHVFAIPSYDGIIDLQFVAVENKPPHVFARAWRFTITSHLTMGLSVYNLWQWKVSRLLLSQY